MLCQRALTFPVRHNRKPMHLMEELERYTMQGHYLHSCTFDDLHQLHRDTYHAFGSMWSSYMALSHNVSKAKSYFARFIDPQQDSLFLMSEEPSIVPELVRDTVYKVKVMMTMKVMMSLVAPMTTQKL